MILQTYLIKNHTTKWPVYWSKLGGLSRILVFSSKACSDSKKENQKTKSGIHTPVILCDYLLIIELVHESLMKLWKKSMSMKAGTLLIYSNKG